LFIDRKIFSFDILRETEKNLTEPSSTLHSRRLNLIETRLSLPKTQCCSDSLPNWKMSRIGKKPVSVPSSVTVSIEANVLKVKGAKGELTVSFEPEYVSFVQENDTIVVTRADDTKPARARHGLYRSLLANAIEGVTNGYSKSLEIKGVGYRGALKGAGVEFQLGFSHPIQFDLPAGVSVEFDKKTPTLFTVSGINKQLVGQAAANIRALKKPEPYKGKGIRYTDEHVVRKAGKSAKK
jgi:large subunit ribosomal protein L6